MDRAACERILNFGVERGISDLHFEVGHPPHLRLQGDLLPAKYPPLRPEDTDAVAQVLLGAAYAKFKEEHSERDVTYSIEGVSRFRATVFWQQGYVGAVLRVIPLTIRTFEQLNLPTPLNDLCVIRRGLILVSGATGNGKSTTMAAMLHRINQTRRAHVVTIEDPIEFLYPKEKSLFIQREVGTDTPSYRAALTAALRQDPDVIMLGEIRDYETAEICLKGAETGHLVLSAIHTPDAVHTVQRFVGLFPPEDHESARVRLAEALKATVSLRLLPTTDGQARVPAVEIMRVTRTIQECIRHEDKLTEVPAHITKGKDLYGMQTFDQHLLELFQRKKISFEVGKMAASNPEEFQRSLTIE
ncbi:MAG: PilT/PilU family type 4a pilus ATPase [Deltaproteobacteria bacterium]|nr:PilT/PilU family type 4a pilus ATPase [Deltaproteobacteria bacterium]